MTPSVWPNFSIEELTCHCGCGQMKMNADAMSIFVKVRQFFGAPWTITSAYRCPAHDAQVGTSSTPGAGPHVLGVALDLNIYGDELDRLMGIIYHDLKGLITGKGLMQIAGTDPNKRLLHLDVVKPGEMPNHPRPGIWTYPSLGGG